MDEREFSMRVHGCMNRLWRISWSILRCGADCDDAVQEAIFRAWRKRGTLREEKYFETWLTRILINECRRMLRRRGSGNAPAPESYADQAEPENPELADAIAALPVELRLPIVLHYMEGYRIQEIAGILRLPETTVKWRLRSGRQRLRCELDAGEEVRR